jgi:hypothetical protein
VSVQHKDLASGKWAKMSFAEQMANVGSEVERALNWRAKKNYDYSRRAWERALELMDLTLGCSKGLPRLKELARTREALVDYFFGSNEFKSSENSLRNYFSCFTFLARKAV